MLVDKRALGGAVAAIGAFIELYATQALLPLLARESAEKEPVHRASLRRHATRVSAWLFAERVRTDQLAIVMRSQEIHQPTIFFAP